MHIYLTSLHTTNEGFAQKFIEDLRKAVEMVKQSPDPNSGWVCIYLFTLHDRFHVCHLSLSPLHLLVWILAWNTDDNVGSFSMT